MKSKIGVVSGITSLTESEANRKFPFLSNSINDYDPVQTRFSKSQAEVEEPTGHNASSQAILWLTTFDFTWKLLGLVRCMGHA